MSSSDFEAVHRPLRIRSAGARALAAEPAERVLLSVREAAQRVGVSEKTIRRYIDAGRLRAFRFGSKLIRVDIADLDAMLTAAHPAYA